jgi:hypothetical protein
LFAQRLVGAAAGMVSFGSLAGVVTVTALLGGERLFQVSPAVTVKTYVVEGDSPVTSADVPPGTQTLALPFAYIWQSTYGPSSTDGVQASETPCSLR